MTGSGEACALALLALSVGMLAGPQATAAATACDADLARVQRRLIELHYPAGPVDGCPGPRTALAIQAFQRVNRLVSDGTAGPRTLRALRNPRVLRPASRRRASHIEVDLGHQLLVRVKKRRIVAIYAVSTGKRGFETPAGRYRVRRKARRSWSREYHVWLRWASYFSARGFAIHAGSVRPFAASHGCVRVAPEFAPQVYRAIRVGMPVLIRKLLR
ncbi:MAG: L,D-transpeptidase family protein [Actinomycetota bacterium]|nr:L,D-transpeptidase family protein [Actinomycetota bacterium]